MTEQEWLECAGPRAMLKFLNDKVSDRKLRLFNCAVCRTVWNCIPDERSKKAVETAERFADGLATLDDLKDAQRQASAARWDDERNCTRLRANGKVQSQATTLMAAWLTAHPKLYPTSVIGYAWPTEKRGEEPSAKRAWRQARDKAILFDLFGPLPFRPIPIDPTWMAWDNCTVPKIAQTIYDERAFDRLPILADALTDAGCDNADILNHCRREGPHVKGCWVVDLLLGKQ